MSEPLILSVDQGGSRTRLASLSGEMIKRIEEYPTPNYSQEAIGKLAATSSIVLDGKKPDTIGLSVAGNVMGNHIVSAGELKNKGWVDQDIVKEIAEAIGVDPDNIAILNDCAAGATAERVANNLPPEEVGAFMVLSTGFGGALYKGTELIPDEPGHYHLAYGAICGCKKDGCIEAHVSGSGIARKYGQPGENILHTDKLWLKIKGDFHESMALTLERYKKLGISPQIIGFAGSVAINGPSMLVDLQRAMSDKFSNKAPKICEAVYGEESGLYGAAFAAGEILKAT